MMGIYEGTVEDMEARIAANPNDVKALSSQGCMYFEGILCLKNEPRGLDFIQRAAALADENAIHNLRCLREMGKLPDIPDPRLAEELHLKAYYQANPTHIESGIRYQFLASTRLVRAGMRLSPTPRVDIGKVFAFPKLFSKDIAAWSLYLPQQQHYLDLEAERKLRRTQHLVAYPAQAEAINICHDLYEISSRDWLRRLDINAHLKKASSEFKNVFNEPFYCGAMKRTCIGYIHALTDSELETKVVIFPDGEKTVPFGDMTEPLAEELFQSDLDMAFDLAVEVAEINSGRRWFNLSFQEHQDYISSCWAGALQLFEFKEPGEILKMQHLINGKEQYFASIRGVEINRGIPTLLWNDGEMEDKRRSITLEICRQLWELICDKKSISCSLNPSMHLEKAAPITGLFFEKNYSDPSLVNSLLGDILMEGDLALKHIISGLTWRCRNNVFYVSPSNLPIEEYQEILNKANALRDHCPNNRACFIFDKINCMEEKNKKKDGDSKEAEEDEIIHFEDVVIQVEYSALDPNPTTMTGFSDFIPVSPDVKLASDAKKEVVMYLETNFSKFASQSPALFAIREVGRLYGMLKYLRERGLPFTPTAANINVGGLGTSSRYSPFFPRTCYLTVPSSVISEGGVRLDSLQLIRIPVGDDPSKGYKMKDGSVCTRNQVAGAIAFDTITEAVPLAAATLFVPEIREKVHPGCAPQYIESRMEDVGKPAVPKTTLQKAGALAVDLAKKLNKDYASGRMQGH